MKRMAAIALAVAMLALTGCGPSGPAKSPVGTSAVATDQGLELRASVAAATLAPGAVPAVRVEVRNTGNSPVRYIKYDGCDKGFHVWMEQGGARTGIFVEQSDSLPRACTDAVQFAELQPGAVIAATYVYRALPDQPRPGGGGHAIKVSFNRGTGVDAVQPLVVALSVTVR